MKLANQDKLTFAHDQEAMRRLERRLKYVKHRWKGSTLFIDMTSGSCPLCLTDIKGVHTHQINQGDLEKYERTTGK
jgi:hypothetical protein